MQKAEAVERQSPLSRFLRKFIPGRREQKTFPHTDEQIRATREYFHRAEGLTIRYVVEKELNVPTSKPTEILVATHGTGQEWTSTATLYEPDKPSDKPSDKPPTIVGKARFEASSMGEASGIERDWIAFSTLNAENLGPRERPADPRGQLDISSRYSERLYRVTGY